MLRISKLADYATVVMTHIARYDQQRHTARNIAETTHIGLATVSKILKRMAQANLLISQQGSKGGYALKRSAEEISLADIVQAIEGEFGLTDCSLSDKKQCHIESFCHIRNHWQLISQTIFESLQKLTLAEMAQPIMMKPFSAQQVGIASNL